MANIYENTLKIQIRRLRNTALASLILGAFIGEKLLEHAHTSWALIAVIITVQVSIGSYIMMGDAKRDLRYIRAESRQKKASADPG